jgi:hypothetical protein
MARRFDIEGVNADGEEVSLRYLLEHHVLDLVKVMKPGDDLVIHRTEDSNHYDVDTVQTEGKLL